MSRWLRAALQVASNHPAGFLPLDHPSPALVGFLKAMLNFRGPSGFDSIFDHVVETSDQLGCNLGAILRREFECNFEKRVYSTIH
jgi:hypothetical protein